MICQLYLLMFLKSRMLRLHDMRKRLAVSEVSEEPNKILLFRKAASHIAKISLQQVKSSHVFRCFPFRSVVVESVGVCLS